MLGPFVMAGLSHGDRALQLPEPRDAGELSRRVYPPEEEDELLSLQVGSEGAGLACCCHTTGVAPAPPSLHAAQRRSGCPAAFLRVPLPPRCQAGWNSSLLLRHDASLVYVSAVEDGGDALDATFRMGRGCHHGKGAGASRAAAHAGDASQNHGLLSVLHGHNGQGEEGATHDAGRSAPLWHTGIPKLGREVQRCARAHACVLAATGAVAACVPSSARSHHALASAFESLRSLMRLGQHDAGQQLSLEAMGAPNHYLAYDHRDVIVLQPVSDKA